MNASFWFQNPLSKLLTADRPRAHLAVQKTTPYFPSIKLEFDTKYTLEVAVVPLCTTSQRRSFFKILYNTKIRDIDYIYIAAERL